MASATSIISPSGDNRDERLVQIFTDQINVEIARRMETLCDINTNIRLCKRNLDQLRKQAINKFYMDHYKDKEVDQPSIHPAVQKIIGKRPAVKSDYNKYLQSNAFNLKRKMRLKCSKDSRQHTSKTSDDSVQNIQPCYIPPKIPGDPLGNCTTRGNARKFHMRVMIGNITKQLDQVSEDSATHKWLVYVRSMPGSLSVEQEVSKVCFFLHNTYSPNVVTVPAPPFTLIRRGWGEFPVRVQLYFKNHSNKSVGIIHALKLSGTTSGRHFRSVETFADLWIYPMNNETKSSSRGSEQILSLASTILKEFVPNFASEARCYKCLSSCCSCDPTDLCQGSIRTLTPQPSDLSESDDSLSGADFLGSMNVNSLMNHASEELDNERAALPMDLKFSLRKGTQDLNIANLNDSKTQEQNLCQYALTTSEINDSTVMQDYHLEDLMETIRSDCNILNDNEITVGKSSLDFAKELAQFSFDNLINGHKIDPSHLHGASKSPFMNSEDECIFNLIGTENAQIGSPVKIISGPETKPSLFDGLQMTANYLESQDEIKKSQSEKNQNIHLAEDSIVQSKVVKTEHVTMNNLHFVENSIENGQNMDLYRKQNDEIRVTAKSEMHTGIFDSKQEIIRELQLTGHSAEHNQELKYNQKQHQLFECVEQNVVQCDLLDPEQEKIHELQLVGNPTVLDHGYKHNEEHQLMEKTDLRNNFLEGEQEIIRELQLIGNSLVLDQNSHYIQKENKEPKSIEKSMVLCNFVTAEQETVQQMHLELVAHNQSLEQNKKKQEFHLMEKSVLNGDFLKAEQELLREMPVESPNINENSFLNPKLSQECQSMEKCMLANDLVKIEDTRELDLVGNLSNQSDSFKSKPEMALECKFVGDSAMHEANEVDSKCISPTCSAKIETLSILIQQEKSNSLVFSHSSPGIKPKIETEYNKITNFEKISNDILQCTTVTKRTVPHNQLKKKSVSINTTHEPDPKRKKLLVNQNEDSKKDVLGALKEIPLSDFIDNFVQEIIVDPSDDLSNNVKIESYAKSEAQSSQQMYIPPSLKKNNLSTTACRKSSVVPMCTVPITKSGSISCLNQSPVVTKKVLPVKTNSPLYNGTNYGSLIKKIGPNILVKNTLNIQKKGNQLINKNVAIRTTDSNVNKNSNNNQTHIAKHNNMSLLKSSNSIKPLQSLLKINHVKSGSSQLIEDRYTISCGNSSKSVLKATATQVHHISPNVIKQTMINHNQTLKTHTKHQSHKLNPQRITVQNNGAKTPATRFIRILNDNSVYTNTNNVPNRSLQFVKTKFPLVQNTQLNKIRPGIINGVKTPVNRSNQFILVPRNQQKLSENVLQNVTQLPKNIMINPTHQKCISQSSLKEGSPIIMKSNVQTTTILLKSANGCFLPATVKTYKNTSSTSIEEKEHFQHTGKLIKNTSEKVRKNDTFTDVRSFMSSFKEEGLEMSPTTTYKVPILLSNTLHSSLNDNIPDELTLMSVDRSRKEPAVQLQVDYFVKQVRLLVRTCKLKDVELAVRWLLRGLPLVHANAKFVSYKMVHPYCAPTLKTFYSWPAPKKAASEWLRAKIVARLLSTVAVPFNSYWSTKEIFRWARSHGYTPSNIVPSTNTDENVRDETVIQQISERQWRNSCRVIEWIQSVSKHKQQTLPKEEDCIDVDTMTCSGSEPHFSEAIDYGASVLCGKPWVQEAQSYVRQEVNCVGVRLGLESIVPGGPLVPAAATVLSHSAMAFIEDLLRRSLAASHRRGGGEIAHRDVCASILQREEFDVFSSNLMLTE